jgi:hypothetical protein
VRGDFEGRLSFPAKEQIDLKMPSSPFNKNELFLEDARLPCP